MQILQNALIPALLAGISLYALCKGVDVFPTFLRGAAVGLKTAVQILPVMVGMLTVVFMLRASGAVDIAASVLAPALRILGIPKECTVLTLLKPISGGGGLAMGSEIIRRCGPDSYAGRVAAVMLGASETSSVHDQRVQRAPWFKPNQICCILRHCAAIWQHLPPLQHWLDYISHTVNIISCMLKNYHSL